MKITLSLKDGIYSLNGNRLDPSASQKIRNHSPDGFNHGYGGSGPAQLALAICLELFGEEKAKKVYQNFKWKYISSLEFYSHNFDTELELDKEFIG